MPFRPSVVLASLLLLAACGRSQPASAPRQAPQPPRPDAGVAPVPALAAPPSRDAGPAVPPWAEDMVAEWQGNRLSPATVMTVALRTAGRAAGQARADELAAQEVQGATPGMTFDALERNPERWRGKYGVFSGRVLEIRDLPEGGTFLRLGVDRYGLRALAVYALLRPGDDVLRGARVSVYGFGGGEFTYTSAMGATLTIPRVNAIAVAPESTVYHPRRRGR